MSKFAFVTLLLNSDYLPGTLALAQSLVQTGSTIPIVLLYSKSNTSVDVHNILRKSGYFQRFIDVDLDLFESRNNFELNELLKRSDLSHTLTKLNIWRLIDYDRLVYLDSDILISSNIDNLLTIHENLSENDIMAASDSGWPDIFNSGLFVIKPSLTVFKKLIKFYKDTDSFDGADQGLLNEYFNLQSHRMKSNWFRLPFTYNCTLNSNYEYLPAMIRFKDSIKVFHFIGLNKPWSNHNLCYSDKYIKIFNNGRDNLYQLWWNVFENVQIEEFTSVNILEISGHLQPPINIKSLSLDDDDLLADSENKSNVDETSAKCDTEITNPFLSPTKQPIGPHFPMYYYKKPNTNEIVDESSRGEAWKMAEGKVSWPKDNNDHNDKGNELVISMNPVDSYVQKNPIFPWEKKQVKKQVSRTFENALKYDPPVYSISIMNNQTGDQKKIEFEDDSNNEYNLSDAAKTKLVGFDDGEKFEEYLSKVETARYNQQRKESNISNLVTDIKKEIKLEEIFDDELGNKDVFYQESGGIDKTALCMSKEDSKVEEDIENSDNEIIGRVGTK